MIEVLLLHRRQTAADVITGIGAALAVGSASPDVVAVETRKAAAIRADQNADNTATAPSPAKRSRDRVVSLTERRLTDLAADERPLPSVAAYDQLLTRASS